MKLELNLRKIEMDMDRRVNIEKLNISLSIIGTCPMRPCRMNAKIKIKPIGKCPGTSGANSQSVSEHAIKGWQEAGWLV